MALSKVNPNLITQGASGRKNLIINGAMNVAQRGTSSAGLGADATTYLLDRWAFGTGGTAGRLTMSQDSDGPAGFANSLKIDCTTADTSIAVGEQSYLIYKFEGQDLQQLKKGTSSAESMTLSFYVKGNAAATYTAEFYDADNARQNGQTFNVTTSWNRVTLTYAPDTTGAYTDDNTIGVYVVFWIHAGSNHTSGTFTSNSWAGDVTANRVSASNTSFFDSTSRTLNITGVQLEVGSVATDFEHRSYGEELALCQRYCHVFQNGSTEAHLGVGAQYNVTAVNIALHLPNSLRVSPTVERILDGSSNWLQVYVGGASQSSNSVPQINDFSGNTIRLYCPSSITNRTAGEASWCHVKPNAKLILSAEL